MGEEIINEDEKKKKSRSFKYFFSSAVKNLKVPEYQEGGALANNISYPIIKAFKSSEII